MAKKYSVFFKITQPLFFIDGNFESKQEAEEEFKKKLTKGNGEGSEFSLKLNNENVKIIKVIELN